MTLSSFIVLSSFILPWVALAISILALRRVKRWPELKAQTVSFMALNEGDVILLKADCRADLETLDRLRAHVQVHFSGHSILVLDNSVSLGVIARQPRFSLAGDRPPPPKDAPFCPPLENRT